MVRPRDAGCPAHALRAAEDAYLGTKGGDCKALPGVKADVTKLVQGHLATP